MINISIEIGDLFLFCPGNYFRRCRVWNYFDVTPSVYLQKDILQTTGDFVKPHGNRLYFLSLGDILQLLCCFVFRCQTLTQFTRAQM